MSNVVTNDIDRPEHPDEQAPARVVPLTLTCPPWCTVDADGHQWDTSRDKWPVRDHEAAFDAGEVGIYLASDERLTPEGFTLGDPRVVITPPPGGDGIPVDQVRPVIESLYGVLAAADGAPSRTARYQEIVDRDKRVKLSAPATIPPCPAWCRDTPGHGYRSVEEDEVTFIRYHRQSTSAKTPQSRRRNGTSAGSSRCPRR